MVQLICTAAELVPQNGIWGFLQVWAAMSAFVYVVLTGLSTLCFIYYYVYPTYEKWCSKSNPKYPSPTYVMGEVFLGGIVGPWTVTLFPSLHLYLIANGTFANHCDTPLTLQYRLISAVLALLTTDFYEWGWHYLGHWIETLWSVHKHHHRYYNPTPFGTIADYPMDNMMRSLYPIVDYVVGKMIFGMPLDIDVVYVMAGMLNMGYGMYLHCGHELECLPHDHPILNTSFQHFAHHAISVKNKPYHTGFFIKLWDNVAGSIYKGEQVRPAVEDCKLGNRSKERWETEVKPKLPDYSVLVKPCYWMAHWKHAPGLSFF